MSELRMTAGTVTAATLNGSDSYIISQWPAQTGQTFPWRAVQKDAVRKVVIPALDGLGAFYGLPASAIEILGANAGMMQYLYSTILQSKPRNAVTVKLYDHHAGWTVYNGIAVWPLRADGAYEIAGYTALYNVRIELERLTVAASGA